MQSTATYVISLDNFNNPNMIISFILGLSLFSLLAKIKCSFILGLERYTSLVKHHGVASPGSQAWL